MKPFLFAPEGGKKPQIKRTLQQATNFPLQGLPKIQISTQVDYIAFIYIVVDTSSTMQFLKNTCPFALPTRRQQGFEPSHYFPRHIYNIPYFYIYVKLIEFLSFCPLRGQKQQKKKPTHSCGLWGFRRATPYSAFTEPYSLSYLSLHISYFS